MFVLDGALLSHTYAFRVIYCIVWIILGVFLLFFGLPSFYWATSPRFAPRAGKTSRRILGGGVGGALVGFLTGSFLAGIITNAVSTRRQTTLTPGGVFATWLAPGLVLGLVSAHVRLLSRIFLGLLSGVCLTLILTATFGIHTILARSVLLAIFCVALTLPQIIPPSKTRYPRTKRFLLNFNTSVVGAKTFLDGVALFAPPLDASRAWIDLWTLLFAPDESPSQHITIQAWGSGAFKGYIAGAILSIAISVAFEAWFHSNAGESAEDEWNEYLGVYTDRLEKGSGEAGAEPLINAAAAPTSRAGMFEQPLPLWRRIADRLEHGSSRGRRARDGPAQYGNIAGGASAPAAGGFSFTQRSPSSMTKKRPAAYRSTSRSSAAPARFQPSSAKSQRKLGDVKEYDDEDDDDDQAGRQSDSDSDATDVDAEDAAAVTAGKSKFKSRLFQSREAEALDTVPALPKLVNYGGYALPAPTSTTGSTLSATPSSRPPSFRTDSDSSASGRTSQLSGSTAVSAADGDVTKPFTSYRDGDAGGAAAKSGSNASRTPRSSAPAALSTPATPSLINAIERIQRAQEQARQWASQREGGAGGDSNNEPYGPQGSDDVKSSK